MKPQLRFEGIGRQHADRAVEMVMSAYARERAHLPDLPEETEFRDFLEHAVGGLLEGGSGIAALEGDDLVGFLAAYEADEMFGSCKGAYIPLYGHAVVDGYDASMYCELYTRAADLWVRKGITTHAATLYAHERETIDTWFWLGFGLRCVDSIRKASPLEVPSANLKVKKADLADIPAIADIHRKHLLYYRTAPIFMPREVEDPVQDLAEWMSEPDHHLWIAFSDDGPLGYIRIQPDGESFISLHPSVMNITGAYVIEESRGAGAGTAILGEIQQWLSENGYRFCGVDFESINAVGSRFWNRHFTPYTYSLVRRIDERISRFL